MFAGYTIFLPTVKLNWWLMKCWKGSFRAKDGCQTLVETKSVRCFSLTCHSDWQRTLIPVSRTERDLQRHTELLLTTLGRYTACKWHWLFFLFRNKLTGNPHFKDCNIKRESCLIDPFSHPQIHSWKTCFRYWCVWAQRARMSSGWVCLLHNKFFPK